MKHKTLMAKSAEELDTKIQELLDQGWDMYGPSYLKDNIIHQPMLYGHDESMEHNNPAPRDDGGITPDEVATISLLRSLFRRPRHRGSFRRGQRGF